MNKNVIECEVPIFHIPGTTIKLPPDVTHYLIPDGTVAKDFLEMLEFPEIRGIIFMQTVANYVSIVKGELSIFLLLENQKEKVLVALVHVYILQCEAQDFGTDYLVISRK
jgi:hypothetical protein